jgi:DNA polymerase I
MGPLSPVLIQVFTAKELNTLKITINQAKFLCIDTETFNDQIRLLQIHTSQGFTFIIDFFKFEDMESLLSLLDNDKLKIFFNAKTCIKALKNENFKVSGCFFDTMLAYQVLKAGTYTKGSLQEICFELLDIELDRDEEASDWSNPDLSWSQIDYAAMDASILLPLYKALKKRLIDENLARVAQLEFESIESTVEMELNGIKIDIAKLLKLKDEANVRLEKLEAELKEDLEAPDINLNSPSQLKQKLNEMGIEINSTSKGTLIPLVSNYPVLAKILAYRKDFKMVSSFLNSLPSHTNTRRSNKIFPSYNQIGCVTGRYSCSNPNLQQIPRDSKVRECFIVPAGKKLVIADFSQIELRVVAELTQDKKMLEAFNNGEDLHSLTASLVCQKHISQVSAEERTKAKAINFGLTFGMSVFALKNYTLINYGLEMSWWQAWRFHDRFFEAYSALKEWHQTEKEKVSTECFTMSGRRRSFPEESWFTVQLNTPIQGTAADVMKKSLALLLKRLRGTEIKIIGTVHDEILLEAPENEAEEAAVILEDSMKKGGETYLKSVPVKVDIKIGMNWGIK